MASNPSPDSGEVQDLFPYEQPVWCHICGLTDHLPRNCTTPREVALYNWNQLTTKAQTRAAKIKAANPRTQASRGWRLVYQEARYHVRFGLAQTARLQGKFPRPNSSLMRAEKWIAERYNLSEEFQSPGPEFDPNFKGITRKELRKHPERTLRALSARALADPIGAKGLAANLGVDLASLTLKYPVPAGSETTGSRSDDIALEAEPDDYTNLTMPTDPYLISKNLEKVNLPSDEPQIRFEKREAGRIRRDPAAALARRALKEQHRIERGIPSGLKPHATVTANLLAFIAGAKTSASNSGSDPSQVKVKTEPKIESMDWSVSQIQDPEDNPNIMIPIASSETLGKTGLEEKSEPTEEQPIKFEGPPIQLGSKRRRVREDTPLVIDGVQIGVIDGHGCNYSHK
ncbi:hypothetical protein BT63DRAFT_129266 [Microthyrium microscopicum]|uniref:Uncharacterized protein n=1 Tax=Microthyrium microscopicum TaxID=703497 RepID=A0A6A6TTW3_9PEZI|nr:hypothetical protein BT63DRAFT_129266 [Microthyrium microscopicum]